MGRRAHHPRRGSLGYSPRKRVQSQVPRIRNWVRESKVRIQGFAGYKAGTTHVAIIDDYSKSPTHGEEIATAATVIEVPPLKVLGVRVYGSDTHGLKIIGEARAKDESKDLLRVLPPAKELRSKVEDLDKLLNQAKEVRVLVYTQPRLSGLGKKTPEIMEYAVGGAPKESLEYAKKILGREIKFGEVFEAGEFIDTISVTKGKGFQGALKRWGLKHLARKSRKGHRTVGSLGPITPGATMWSVPQSGQMGHQQRTEFNKRILKIGSGSEAVPKGGFLNYGIVNSDYVILKGSVAGPRKRLIRLRPAIRPPRRLPEGKPQVTYVSLESKQGA